MGNNERECECEIKTDECEIKWGEKREERMKKEEKIQRVGVSDMRQRK